MSLLAAVLLLAPANGSVVVLPPENRGSTDAPWVAEAVADGLPRALGLLSLPAVERSDRLSAQEALGIPALPLTRATSIRVAEALGASRLVTGTYALGGADVVLSLRLLDVERATLSSPLVVAGAVESLPELIYGLAWDVALSGPTPPSRAREEFLSLRPKVPFEAFKAYAEGLAAPDPASRVREIRRALGLAPTYDEARIALGRARLETREYAVGLETLSRVPDAAPLARPARFLEGVALLRLGRYRDAARLYERLAAGDPTPAALNNQALALARLGTSRGRPSQLLRDALEKEPAAGDLPFNLGWALLLEGEAEAAAFWLRGVTTREPRDAHARALLSWALRQSGREAEAAEEWRGLALLSPSYESLAVPDLTRRFERIRVSERMPVLDTEDRSDAEMAATHVNRAEKLAAGGDQDEALAELTRAVFLDPYGARVHLLLARVYRARGEAEKAVSELKLSLWCREDAAVRLALAALLKERGRTAEARTEALKVLQSDPGNAEARRLAEAP